ncbi:TspO/MBR family protein [Mucilaginibacter sp. X4EP1]|uniref:TspO/MBR family protein n=1 Tax=Mucilaginibacter sp. X4EP1 TaxID=2723092 RepID=UPI002167D5F3|nr:TspO/MBR family protein [Mucilaginibacter sp. X4EP1]MCS3813368.1 tryptophan-rich sensory protein [Mucilaginibacter sp. X4EP1]
MNKFKIWPFVISLLITLSIGTVAGFVTTPQISTWYAGLNKPLFNPPDWSFGPAWTLLYIMMAIAAYLVWDKRHKSNKYTSACIIYFVQLLLNFLWSIVFFGMHQILGALVIIGLLFFSIMITIAVFKKISKAAAWLLAPYLLWVAFAGVLNFDIYILNR